MSVIHISDKGLVSRVYFLKNLQMETKMTILQFKNKRGRAVIFFLPLGVCTSNVGKGAPVAKSRMLEPEWGTEGIHI